MGGGADGEEGGSSLGADFIHFLYKVLGKRTVKKLFEKSHLKRPHLEKVLPTPLDVIHCKASEEFGEKYSYPTLNMRTKYH